MGYKFCVVCLIELNNDLLRTFLIFQIDFLMVLRTVLRLGFLAWDAIGFILCRTF